MGEVLTHGSGDLKGLARREERRREAFERHAARKNRSAKEQLALLDRKLGVGKGAKRERSRLEKMIKEDHGGKKKSQEEEA